MTDRDPAKESIFEYQDRKAKEAEINLWLAIRQALLMVVDAIERAHRPSKPRTSELRKEKRQP